MSTTKKVIKTTQKTEPAGTKKGTKPAAPKTDGKKNVTPAKETATPAPAPEVMPIAKHEEVVAKKNNLLQRAKEQIIELEERLKVAETKAANTAEDVAGFGEKVNDQTSRKWVGVGLLLLLLAAGVWIFFLQRHNNELEKTVQDKNAVIQQRDNTIQSLRDEVNYDTTHAANSDIKAPDVDGSKKKILNTSKP